MLPVEQYVAGLARKRMAAGCCVATSGTACFLVEPTYKPNWEIPGGAVEEDEAPWETVRRELCEEIGWDQPVGRLLLVDYVRPQDSRPEGVVFLFDGGVLSDSDVAGMVLHPGEIPLCGALHAR